MKIAGLIILGLCCGVAGQSSNAASHRDIQPLQAVRDKFSAFNRHDVNGIEALYSAAAILNSPDYNHLVGNEAIADTYRKLFDAIPDAKDSIERLECVGKHVYAQFVLSGHWQGMQDKPINVRIMSAYSVEDGRIVEDATYYDRKTS